MKEPKRLSEEIWEWGRLLSGPFLVSSLTSAFTLVANVLLLKYLEVEQAGLLALILAAVQIIPMLADLGQSTLILRVYSAAFAEGRNWPRDLFVTAGLSIPLILLGSLLATFLYKLSLLHSLVVLAISLLTVINLTLSRMLNAGQRYTVSSLLMRLPNGLLILPALLVWLHRPEGGLNITLLSYLASTAGISLLGIVVLRGSITVGGQHLKWSERLSGLVFLGTQLSYRFPDQGLIAIAGVLLSRQQVATFAAMATLAKSFDLVTDVSRGVFTTEMLRREGVGYSRLQRVVWTFAILASAAFILFGPAIAGLIYQGRYQRGTLFIPWLGIAGLLKITETLPRSLVIGFAGNKGLRQFVLLQVFSAAVGLSLSAWLGSLLAGLGTAIAAALISLGRYGITQLHARKLNPAGDDQLRTPPRSSE